MVLFLSIANQSAKQYEAQAQTILRMKKAQDARKKQQSAAVEYVMRAVKEPEEKLAHLNEDLERTKTFVSIRMESKAKVAIAVALNKFCRTKAAVESTKNNITRLKKLAADIKKDCRVTARAKERTFAILNEREEAGQVSIRGLSTASDTDASERLDDELSVHGFSCRIDQQ